MLNARIARAVSPMQFTPVGPESRAITRILSNVLRHRRGADPIDVLHPSDSPQDQADQHRAQTIAALALGLLDPDAVEVATYSARCAVSDILTRYIDDLEDEVSAAYFADHIEPLTTLTRALTSAAIDTLLQQLAGPAGAEADRLRMLREKDGVRY